MLFSSISWVILTFTLLVALPGALASPSPKRSKKTTSTRVSPEIYPAMENGEAIDPARVATLAKNTPKNMKTNRRVQTLGTPAPLSAPISAPAAYVANDSPAPEKFVVVPAEKRAQIMKRMTLCQELFQTTGRAYDYRSMTTAQLQEELNAVRADERPIAAQNPSAAANPNQFEPVNAAPTEPDPILDAQE